MKYVFSTIGLSFLFFLSSCCHNVNTTCTPGHLNVYVAGFEETDLSASSASPIPPYVIRYQQDNAFDKPIDSMPVTHFVSGLDTYSLNFLNVQISGANIDSFEGGLVLGYDYKIVIPADTVTYLITNLNASGSSQMVLQKCGDKSPPACFRNAATCNVNGNAVAVMPALMTVNANANFYTYPNSTVILSR